MEVACFSNNKRAGSRAGRFPRAIRAAAVVALLAPAAVRAADVSWIGPSVGQWHVEANWSGGAVPAPEDNVTIEGATVSVSDMRVLEGAFTLSANAMLLVNGAEASFEALGSTALSDGRVSVGGGAMAAFPGAVEYEWTLASQELIFHVSGEGSFLDLPGLTSVTINGPAGESLLQNFTASAGGMLDLSGLETITAVEGQQLTLTLITGGQILLPSLASMDRGFLLLTASTTADLPMLEGLFNSTILVPEGGRVTANALRTAENTIFSLGGLGAVEFPKLETLTSSQLSINGTGRVSLPALTALRNTNVSLGNDSFLNVPELITLEAAEIVAFFTANGTGAVSAPKLRAARNIAFAASDGAVLNLPRVESYTWDLCEGGIAFSTGGAGSTLNFSGLRTFTVETTACTGQGFPIGASGGSMIDLSGLRTIATPAGQFVTFLASNAGTVIDLSSLSSYNVAMVTFLELDSGRIIRSGGGGGGGEGEGEGEGEVPGGGCPAPGAGARSSAAGDGILIAALLAAFGLARRRTGIWPV